MDWRWNSRARVLFRILAAILGVLFLTAGVLYVSDKDAFKFGLASLGFGIVFIIVAGKGSLFRDLE